MSIGLSDSSCALPAPLVDAMREAAGRACGLLRAMANEDRLLILCQLVQGERNVGELRDALGIAQPTLSQQLGVLRDEGLVATRREGKYVYYRLVDPAVLSVVSTLAGIYCPKPGDHA